MLMFITWWLMQWSSQPITWQQHEECVYRFRTDTETSEWKTASGVARVLARYARVFQTSLIPRVSDSQQVSDRTARKTKNIQRETQAETSRWFEGTEERLSTGSSWQGCGNAKQPPRAEKASQQAEPGERMSRKTKSGSSAVRKEHETDAFANKERKIWRKKILTDIFIRKKNLCAKYGNAQECSWNAGSIQSCHKKTKKQSDFSEFIFFLLYRNNFITTFNQSHILE